MCRRPRFPPRQATVIPCALLSWPVPLPLRPIWQVLAVVQVWNAAAPVSSPKPNAWVNPGPAVVELADPPVAGVVDEDRTGPVEGDVLGVGQLPRAGTVTALLAGAGGRANLECGCRAGVHPIAEGLDERRRASEAVLVIALIVFYGDEERTAPSMATPTRLAKPPASPLNFPSWHPLAVVQISKAPAPVSSPKPKASMNEGGDVVDPAHHAVEQCRSRRATPRHPRPGRWGR